MPRVSVIIVNYNGKDLTKDCLKALGEQNFKDFEILVVDNGSLDRSAYEIQTFLEEYPMLPPVRLISLDRNLGFAGGNLKGLDYAVGEYIALLNNDTEPDRSWLLNLVRALDSDPGVGICASKLINYDDGTIDSAGDGFSVSLRGFRRGEGGRTSVYDKQEYIFGACAGAALYRRMMIEEIGFLDKDFFLIQEDTDLNLRAHLYGWKVIYVPKAVVYHKTRSTIGVMSDTAIYYTLRNSEFVRVKNIPLPVFLRCLPTFVLGAIIEFFYFAVKHRRPILYLEAKLDALKMFPAMLRKRKAIMRAKKANFRDLMMVMTSVFEKSFLKNKLYKLLHG